MSKKRIAVVGYGNIGKYAMEAIEASPDFELAGVVRRDVGNEKPRELADVVVVDDVSKLGNVDAALLCTPTRSVSEQAKKYLQLGINTVDSYDIHTSFLDLRRELMPIAQANNAVAIISSGWDPGSDSVIRTLLEACAPKGLTYTNFGPGMSMGHTVAAKSIDGVVNALSMTIPLGTSIHRRVVYVELASGATIENVTKKIKADPYFSHDETHVIAVESIDDLIDKGHGVNLVRKGVSGKTDNQLFEFNMRINNPALTSQVMLSCARATFKQKPGVYTMPEIPMIDLLYGDKESLLARLV
ncbi:MAG: diaminopimelate dehydrogenase [Proteobacteria bacterium]|nr:diaminopimelate dehydrogenase [Pseudomonadota bacterium]MCL2307707.1 diaminopimelate dehydrogenase [Pseudomonadota bacterium]